MSTDSTAAEASNLRVDQARLLIGRFLDGRPGRTSDAYAADLEEFAHHQGTEPAETIACLLEGGPEAADRTVLAYAVALARRGRARATIARRLTTLRSLVRLAHDLGQVPWTLSVPDADEISAAVDRMPAGDNPHYLFPRDPSEVDRLDIQHYALKATLGVDHLAPIPEPRRVLDAGAGTGQWGFDLLRQFPHCLVVGLDLVPGKLVRPPGYRFVKGNLIHGLPFSDGAFDFVHQRLLAAGLPLASWPAVVADLARVARPGGWVELVEAPWEADDVGPATEGLLEILRRMTASGGLDPRREVFDSLGRYLEQAGLVEVTWRDVALPVGAWGGDVGSLMETDLRAGFMRLCEAMQSRGLITEAEARERIKAAAQEATQRRMALHFAFAFGRKPG